MSSAINIKENLEKFSDAGAGSAIQYDLGTIIGSFINVAILVGAIMALIFMLMGAVQWITAGGDSGKIQKARDKFVQSIIGLGVVASTYAIFLVVQYFFGINIAVVPNGAGSGSGGGTSTSVCTPGQTGSDGGAGGYCTGGGAANMKCFGPGHGVSKFSYNHWEPCGCQSGAEKPEYNFTSC